MSDYPDLCNNEPSCQKPELLKRIEELETLLDGKCPECGESLPSSCYGQSVNCLDCGYIYMYCGYIHMRGEGGDE